MNCPSRYQNLCMNPSAIFAFAVPLAWLLVVALGLALLMPSTARALEAGATGSFVGKSDHEARGTVTIERDAEGYVIRFAEDFFFDGAPDPRIGLGSKGAYDPATDLVELKADRGAQSYRIPAGIDVGAHDEVWIWCRRFSVPLGVAALDVPAL